MKSIKIAVISLILMSSLSYAQLTSEFTYQGSLKQSGLIANGVYEMDFSLWDQEASGSQVGGTIARQLLVVDGIFSVGLDFGVGVFTGADLYLEIAVRDTSNSSNDFVTLSRQLIKSVPYAIKSDTASLADSVANNSISSSQIENNSILSEDIRDQTIESFDIKNESITNNQLASASVGTSELRANSIEGIHIKTGEIDTFHIQDGTIAGVDIKTNLDLAGTLSWKCPAGTTRYGNWCVDNVVSEPAIGDTSLLSCHNQGKNICPLEAIMTCDVVRSNGVADITTSCGGMTDCAGGVGGLRFIRTATVAGGSNSTLAYNNLLQFDGCTNQANSISWGATSRFFCCKPVSN